MTLTLSIASRYNLPTMFRISPLRVRVFNACRLRYRYQYADKVPARLRPADTAGSLVHNILCDFFAKVPREERDEKRLIDMFEERWAALSPRYLRMPGVEELHDHSLGALLRFAQRENLAAEPFQVEAYVQVRIAPDVTLFGRMDRIDEEADGSLHIIDYKTGSHPGDVDASQLQLYAIMAADKERALAGALAAVKEMQSEKRFEPTVAPHCAGCPYLYACAVRDEIAQRRQAEGW